MAAKTKAPTITLLKNVHQNLPCVLTNPELLEKSRSLGQELSRRDSLEAEKTR